MSDPNLPYGCIAEVYRKDYLAIVKQRDALAERVKQLEEQLKRLRRASDGEGQRNRGWPPSPSKTLSK